MSDAPRTIWANVAVIADGQAMCGEWNYCDAGSPGDHCYHHDDVVRELREALESIRDGYGPNHLSKFARDTARAALAKLEAGHE